MNMPDQRKPLTGDLFIMGFKRGAETYGEALLGMIIFSIIAFAPFILILIFVALDDASFLPLTIIVAVLYLLAAPGVTGASYKYFLWIARGEKPQLSEALRAGFQIEVWGKYMLLFLMFIGAFLVLFIPLFIGVAFESPALAVMGGLLAFAGYVGIIYLSIALLLVGPLIIDRGMPLIESLKTSLSLVHWIGWWRIFLVYMCFYIMCTLPGGIVDVIYTFSVVMNSGEVPIFTPGYLFLPFTLPFLVMLIMNIYLAALKKLSNN